jgi:hypothetical protein
MGSAAQTATPAVHAEESLPRARLDTVVGEVVDIQCFSRAERTRERGRDSLQGVEPARDAATGWNECGVSAVRRGAPVGIRLREGGGILVAAMHDRNPAGRALAPFLGRDVTVTGYRVTGGGVPLLEITRIFGDGEIRTSRAGDVR